MSRNFREWKVMLKSWHTEGLFLSIKPTLSDYRSCKRTLQMGQKQAIKYLMRKRNEQKV